MNRCSAITIGNFDGVHLGHRALLKAARESVGPDGQVLALVFDPHPLTRMRPERAPCPISTFDQRVRSLTEAGADDVVRIAPTTEILALDPIDFLARLASDYQPHFLVEGADFRFGRDRRGDVETIRQAGPRFGIEPVIIPAVEVVLSDHVIVRASSTMTRWLLAHGRVRDAALVLGRSYELRASVETGARRGREIGFPTINLQDNGCLLPGDGVYAGRVVLPESLAYPAAISVGTNPTFPGGRRVCEAHLLDYDGPLDHYGWPAEVRFDYWLRDQIAYSSVDDLITQLHRDVLRSRELVAGTMAASSST